MICSLDADINKFSELLTFAATIVQLKMNVKSGVLNYVGLEWNEGKIMIEE